jgi:hypothetical protein
LLLGISTPRIRGIGSGLFRRWERGRNLWVLGGFESKKLS